VDCPDKRESLKPKILAGQISIQTIDEKEEKFYSQTNCEIYFTRYRNNHSDISHLEYDSNPPNHSSYSKAG
jgi:hypothetical protein